MDGTVHRAARYTRDGRISFVRYWLASRCSNVGWVTINPGTASSSRRIVATVARLCRATSLGCRLQCYFYEQEYRMSEALHLSMNRIPTPIGEMLLVADHDGNLRSIDWKEHEDRMRRRFRSEEHTSELQSHVNLVCRLLLEKKKKKKIKIKKKKKKKKKKKTKKKI